MKYSILPLVLTASAVSCGHVQDADVHQSSRDNIIDVQELVHPIEMGEVCVNRWAQPLMVDDYLLVADGKSLAKPFYVFDALTYRHIASFGSMGPGPTEVLNLGHVNWVDNTRELYVSDLSKLHVLSFKLDSALLIPDYKPQVKFRLNDQSTPMINTFMNDSIAFSSLMILGHDDDFASKTGIVNFKSGKVDIMPHRRDDINDYMCHLAVSFSDSIYAECNMFHDLVCILDMHGNLKRNIYGPQWGSDQNLLCFSGALFTKDYLFASYVGKDCERNELATRCEVFSKDGDYVATLNVGFRIMKMCYDAKRDRIVFSFDDDIEFGFINLNEVFGK